MAEKKQPWMKWYPSDWRSEPGLRMVSRAARSLWLDMLGLMHESEPYGELRVNGRPLKAAGIAAQFGDRVSDVSRWLLELKVAGVSSETSDGVIFSRRMVRDRAKALRDKENGARGGNPSVKGGVNPQVKGEDKAQNLEARDQKPEELELSAEADVRAPAFQKFWEEYPTDRNMSRKAAETQWNRLSPVKRVAALAAVPGFKAYCAKESSWYRPLHAERFLSQERFEGYAAVGAGQPDASAARAAWDGKAALLIDALGDKGAAVFSAWFTGANFVPGPPARICLPNAARRTQIEQKFTLPLRKAFGEVILEVAA